MSHPRSRPAAGSLLLPLFAALALSVLPGATCSTGNPGTVFDPDNPGGGGEPPPPPKEPGPRAAPGLGALILQGRPELDAMAPASGVSNVDVQAPVALWFSESLRADTLTPQNLVIRPEGLGGVASAQVSYSVTWLAGNRCAVLQPATLLAPNTVYEVVGNDELTDLEGLRLRVPADGVLGSFKTSPQAAGLAPRVLGSFPPRESAFQPNDHPAILVFSKPMDFTGISSAVDFTNQTTSAPAAYDDSAAPENRHAGNRVFEFPHVDDDADLGARIRLHVDDSLTDADFFPHPLAGPYAAAWNTLSFARPQAVAAVDEDPFDPFTPAVNGQNFDDFQVDVFTAPSALATDSVILMAHEASGTDFVQQTRRASTGAPRFHLDLGNEAGNAPLFGSSGEIVLASFTVRGERRSTVQLARDPAGDPGVTVVDSVAPALLSFGPPAGLFGSQFVADVPELRPYGRATEPVARVRVRFPALGPALERDVFDPPDDGFFAGPAFDLGAVGAGPFPFDVLLTDRYGNAGAAAVPATAAFRGFVGAVPLVSADVRVAAYDLSTLFPIANAQVFIENFGGGAEASGLTGSDGSITFAGRTGAQTVTVTAEGRQAVSVVGLASTEVSLPLLLQTEPVANPAPAITGVTGGVVTVSGSLLAQDDALEEPDLTQEVDLDEFFGPGLTARLQRLGWYAAFHEIEAFPAAGTYFRFFGFDPAILLPPSAGGSVTSPRFAMTPSTNELLAATDHQYPLTIAVGSGFDLPAEDAGSLALARVPGLDHLAAVGAGAVSGASGDAEVELELHAAAVVEGAPAADVILQGHAFDADGDFALARAVATLDANPGTVALTLPGVPEAAGAWTGSAHPFTRGFSATLGAGEGFYRVVIRDDQLPPNTWQLWVSSTAGLGGGVTLPSLKADAVSPPGDPPLADDPGASWSAFVEAYEMPAGFAEIGFYFAALRRDCVGFARSAFGPDLAF